MQALLVAVYALAKLGGVYALVGLWGRLEGALVANIGGSMVGLVLAWIVWRRLEKPTPSQAAFDARSLLRFAAPVALFSLTINLFLNVDLWLVKAFCASADPGYYTAASTIARIPYYLFFGLSATVLPSVSTGLGPKRRSGGASDRVHGDPDSSVVGAAPLRHALVLGGTRGDATFRYGVRLCRVGAAGY